MNNAQPLAEYQSRLSVQSQAVQTEQQSYRRIGWFRLTFLIVGGLNLLSAMFANNGNLLFGLVPIAIISLILLAIHQRIFRRQQRAAVAVAYYQRAVDRLHGNWVGKGISGENFRDSAHPYAEDIDLFGVGSLFELICTARTKAGETTLASWLQAPSDKMEIIARQSAVSELTPHIDLREDLALLAHNLRSNVNPDALIEWGKKPTVKNIKQLRILTAALCGLTIVTLIFGLFAQNFVPLYIALLINTVIGIIIRPHINAILREVEPAANDLKVLAGVLRRIEAEQFVAPKLTQLRTKLTSNQVPPSTQIDQLSRYLNWLDARMNQLFRPLSAPFFFVSQLTLAVESWRQSTGPHVSEWINAVGEIEALCSLAGYAYEHPADVFPTLVDDQQIYEGTALGHPLLVEAKTVRTDIKLAADNRLYVVSGSNMSGKSTLLRTVATNMVLALAGAPVRATSLTVSIFQLGASIRIQDSLRAGASLFYAEISRLRQLMDLASGAPPLLFVIDEILHGTNSHDRRIGAQAVLKGLVAKGAYGLVTTHDLALTNIVGELRGQARNVHLQDHLENGKMTFDYVLRDGIVEKSNAIELMRSVGLDV